MCLEDRGFSLLARILDLQPWLTFMCQPLAASKIPGLLVLMLHFPLMMKSLRHGRSLGR